MPCCWLSISLPDMGFQVLHSKEHLSHCTDTCCSYIKTWIPSPAFFFFILFQPWNKISSTQLSRIITKTRGLDTDLSSPVCPSNLWKHIPLCKTRECFPHPLSDCRRELSIFHWRQLLWAGLIWRPGMCLINSWKGTWFFKVYGAYCFV